MTAPVFEPGSLLLRILPPVQAQRAVPLLCLAGLEELHLRVWADEGQVLVVTDAAAGADEAPLGAALTLPVAAARVVEIRALAVDPAHRGLGIGAYLLEGVADAARASGCRRLLAAATNVDVGSIVLLQRAGFRLTHVERDGCCPERGWSARQPHDHLQARDLLWFDLEL